MAMAEAGTLLNAPDVYMDKIAVGPGYPEGVIDLDAEPADNIISLAQGEGREARAHPGAGSRPAAPREDHRQRPQGGRVRALITDGDVAGVIATTEPETTGIDIYIGQGGAPEGVLAAAALRCVGGQFQTRLVFRNDNERQRAERFGIAI
jgi:fructose-1,6-bisphosphatase II / sedoheptulose-1,7-bisphosphatase